MKRRWAAVAPIAAAVTGGVVVASGAQEAAPPARAAAATTAPVQRGNLSSLVSLDGVLTYRARPDGAPYVATNQARGIYTELPEEGDRIGCGDVLYRVDDDPVLLLCGATPAYRDLRRGRRGRDARQLRRNLRALGHHSIKALQRASGLAATGTLDHGDVVFLPKPVRVAKVTGRLGGFARPGAPVVQGTSATLEVQANLEASQREAVQPGDRARISLPGRSVNGTVQRLGKVAREVGREDDVGAATIPAFIRLDGPEPARGLDQAPVQVDITTAGVKGVLSVPVTALVGRSGGGFAVEVVRDGGRRALVAVRLGLFDTTAGRVQVDGTLRAGDQVVVPSP